LGSIE